MTIVARPSAGTSLLGGSIHLAPNPCRHPAARVVPAWAGDDGTAGTVAVVGAGKMGLPLGAQFASHGWSVIAVDINPDVVATINEGRSPVGDEPGLAELVARVHAEDRLRATLDAAAAARDADVVVLIVPVMLDADHRPDYRYMDAAVASIAPGVHAGSTIIFETTLPIGDTRRRFAPALEAASGLVAERDFFVAFSPERLYSGAVLENLAAYPKLVGGIGPVSTDRAARFYASVLDAEVVAMSSSEAAEFSKLADTTYRDVHQPGIGVGGHCIPVYPHLLLARAPGLSLVETARRVNDGQVDRALAILDPLVDGLAGAPVLVLGVTYRHGVKELAYSRAIALIAALRAAGAHVSAYDPLLGDEEIRALGAEVWHWADPGPFRAIVTQTADPAFSGLDAAWFADLRAVYDGRNSLRELTLPATVAYVGVGVQAASRRSPGG